MKTLKELFTGKKANVEHGQMKSHHEHQSPKHEHHGHSHGSDEHHPSKKYLCPMKCEDDKTYDAPGNCPVCNMILVPVNDTGSHGHQHHGCC
tara:strand:- start:2223 stop:2498 length:276 start_codon:yes stop_codon:yes gene_type:complete